MALMKCPECGKEISSTAKFCGGCGHDLAGVQKRELQRDKNMHIATVLRNSKRWLMIFALCFWCVAAFFFYRGYDVKNNYYYSEYSSSLTRNAYVGGDAYNYIINGTYYTGYSVIASACLLSGVVLITGSSLIGVKVKEYES